MNVTDLGKDVSSMGKDVTLMGTTVTDLGKRKKHLLANIKKHELKKHAATIHCSNTLSLLQRKITNALLYHAYHELMSKDEHVISVKQLCRLIGYQGHNHAVIREAFKGLISTIIEWNLINDETGEENWTASSIIASVSLEGPNCYYAYSPRMKQLLHSPSMFGKIDLVIQSRFRSSYGLALYENCIRYRGLPHTKWFEIDLFRKLMGIPAEKYPIFRDFKRRVLDKAIDEVNAYSDLNIALELIREGRKVRKLRFLLNERAKKVKLGVKKHVLDENNQEKQALKEKLMTIYGVSEKQCIKLLNTYPSDYIKQKISLIETSRPYREGKINNVAAYLLTAIKEDYQSAAIIPLEKGRITNAKDLNTVNVMPLVDYNELRRNAERIRSDYQEYREKVIKEAIDSLTADQKQKFMEKFWQSIEPISMVILKLQRHRYTPGTMLDSPTIQAELRQFALRELDFITLSSLEEFVLWQDEQTRLSWQKLKLYDPDHALLHFSEEIPQ